MKQKGRTQIEKNTVLGSVTTVILVLMLLTGAVYNSYTKAIKKLDTVIEPKIELATPAKANEREYTYCYDPIICIRDVGEELGVKNQDIITMIKIAKCESGFKPNAKNPNSTATGIFQIIIGTWDGNKCEGERWDFVDNIKCAYKLYKARSFQPWDASKHCWDKE